MTVVAELKQTHRATWAAGDYAAVAEVIDEAPPRDLLDRVGVSPGEDVLDVATGTGNIALRAAAAGAHVIGLDLTPELFETARRRAAEQSVVIDWIEGDAEELPFEDGRDRVLSAFGVQFAPRHEIVAHELARVTRPGGRIGLVNWTPTGQVGELFKIMGRYLPPPPRASSPEPRAAPGAPRRESPAQSGALSKVAGELRPAGRAARAVPGHVDGGAGVGARSTPGARRRMVPGARDTLKDVLAWDLRGR